MKSTLTATANTVSGRQAQNTELSHNPQLCKTFYIHLQTHVYDHRHIKENPCDHNNF